MKIFQIPLWCLLVAKILANQEFKENLAQKIENAKVSGKIVQQKLLEKIEKCDCVKENINNNFYWAFVQSGKKVEPSDYLRNHLSSNLN